VDAVEDLVPIRHGLRAEEFIQNGCQLRHVCYQLGRLGESWICQDIGAADGFCHRSEFVGCDDKHEPGSVGSLIYVERRICWVLAIMQSVKLCSAKRGLD